MQWTSLGHAMWLAEAEGLRLLFDPLLAPTHHGGVFEVVPRREVHAAALCPDFIFVSHAHPDHFDVRSLHVLACLDPESVVVTPDARVAWAARALGFSTVRVVPPGQRIELDGVTIVTTPSVDPREWGAMVAANGAAVWNQVDTVLRGEQEVRRVVAEALRATGVATLSLALVRWQPMLEIAAQLGQATAFPYAAYASLLQEIAACGASTVVPSACGGSHLGSAHWLDAHVFPVSSERLLADLAEACPTTTSLAVGIGARLAVAADRVELVAQHSPDLVAVEAAPDALRSFSPLAIPPLCDDNLAGRDVSAMRQRVQTWVEHELAGAMLQAYRQLGTPRPLRCVVSIVFPDVVDAYTLTLGGGAARCDRRADPEWDLLNEVAGSLLWEVIEGRRNWGDVLLAGALRARTRAYRIDDGGLRRLDVGETFLYYALSYDTSVERALRWEVEQVKANPGPH